MVEGRKVDNFFFVVKLYNLIKDFGYCILDRRFLFDFYGIMWKFEEMCFDDGNDKILIVNYLFFMYLDIKIFICKFFKVVLKSVKFIRKFFLGVFFG